MIDFGRITGVVDQDFLRGDQDVDGVAVGFDVECAVGGELQQVEADARLQAESSRNMYSLQGLRGVDARRVLRGVPAVDGGVELHAGIAAVPGGVGRSCCRSSLAL